MKIHYLNSKGEEVFLDEVIHLQNVDNLTWIATTKSGKELTLLTERIEGIADLAKAERKKYWAIVGYRNSVGQFGWNLHYVPIEYEKEYNRVAVNIDGRLFVTSKDYLFPTKKLAMIKFKELNKKDDR